jgi:hypothetical protein
MRGAKTFARMGGIALAVTFTTMCGGTSSNPSGTKADCCDSTNRCFGGYCATVTP